MEITLMQGILLAIMCIIVGLDFFLEAFFLFRPLMVSTFTGLILGDVTLGLTVGALIELAFAGLTPAGGTQPPNPVMAGLMGTVLAYTTGCDAQQALALCLPFSFLGQYIILFYYSAFSFFMGKADDCAANGDTKGIRNINLLTMTIISVTYGVLAFLCAYVAQGPMQAFVEWLPEVVTHGLEIAGGVLPAVGFGMLLRVMMKAKYVPYFIAGFLMTCFIDMPNLLQMCIRDSSCIAQKGGIDMQPIIQLIRVDNRLVHGQTGVTWSNSLDIDTIIVIDDETVQNIFSQKLMTSIAKAGSVHIAFYSIAGFIDAYFSASGGKEALSRRQIDPGRSHALRTGPPFPTHQHWQHPL